MRSAFLVAAYAAYTYAQNLDSDAIAQADPIPTADIPVVYSTSFDYALPSATVIASTIAYDAAAAAASVSAEVAADVNDAQPTDISRRDTTTSCAALKAQGGNYTSPKGIQYTIDCGVDYSGYDLAAVSGSSFADCYIQCDGYPGCVSFSFTGGSGSGTCYLKRRGATAKANSGVNGGALVNMPTLAASLCVAQPTGISHTSSPDTDTAFLADSYYSSAATGASAPTGYSVSFTNLQASNNVLGYLGFSLMGSYDPSACASRCDKVNGCQAINIYFERDPSGKFIYLLFVSTFSNTTSVDPNDSSCSNPTSYSQIKCVYWGGPVTQSNALNNGQYRNQFHVVIAGSNGYVNRSIDTPIGYTAPNYLGNSVVNAPATDCAGYNNSLSSMLWTTGPFDAGRCAAACSAYNANTPATGVAQTCQFFNTYVLKGNGKDAGQYCALYQQSFPSSAVTSSSVVIGGITYTYGYSYTFTNATNAGGPAVPCAVASASRIIGSSTLQPFCSTLLGFNAPTSTATVVFSPASTIRSTTTPAVSSLTSTIVVTSFVSTSTITPKKRDLQIPAALTSFAASIVSSACRLQASSATTSVLTTVTSTASTSFATSIITASGSTTIITVTNTAKATATADPYGCSNGATCGSFKTFACPTSSKDSTGQCACGHLKSGGNVCFEMVKCTQLCDTTSDCNNGSNTGVCVFGACCNNNGSSSSDKGVCMPLSTVCANGSSPKRMFRRRADRLGGMIKRQDTASDDECTALSCPGTWVDETTGVVVDGQAGQDI
ncbi:unnamed protein product [Aureobasidium pullulans]|nr:unnamed protein product [Aureobasidium pullulans]